MNNLKKYNDVEYIKKNFKNNCIIEFDYKDVMCSVFYQIVNKYNKYSIYFEYNVPGCELESHSFYSIEDFFELGNIEGELIKNIWKDVEIVDVKGF